jgi:TDG/mug DNA glycosylase family protein
MSAAHVLPDRLAPGLAVWFVGTAAGPMSAATRTYYAHPGNRFWRALHEARITPQLYSPTQYARLLDHGIGLTDLCKTHWGVDSKISRGQFDVAALRRKVARLTPRALAFTSKTAASLWLDRPTARIAAGRQDSPSNEAPTLFVLPSPSGLATSYWSIEPWRELGRWLGRANLTQREGAKISNLRTG